LGHSGSFSSPTDAVWGKNRVVLCSDLIFYQFSRSKAERGDFSHFLNLYAPDKLPIGGRMQTSRYKVFTNSTCKELIREIRVAHDLLKGRTVVTCPDGAEYVRKHPQIHSDIPISINPTSLVERYRAVVQRARTCSLTLTYRVGGQHAVVERATINPAASAPPLLDAASWQR
jgi:hypothetical protein